MKKIILSLMVVTIVFSACKKEEAAIVVLETPTVVGKWELVSTKTASGTVTAIPKTDKSYETVEFTNDNKFIAIRPNIPSTSNGTYTVTGTNLTVTISTPSTNSFSVSATTLIITNSTGTIATYTKSTTTVTKKIPTVTTTVATAITNISASTGGNVTSDGGAEITARGVCWSTTENQTILLTTKITNGNGSGSFTSTISGLVANTTYYIRAYATNSEGTAYGTQQSFKTATSATLAKPTVKTTSITAITQTTAISGGSIFSDGGAPITSRGVCWSSISTPTADDDNTLNGTGNSDFISNITGLKANTTYYVRAYAINSVGVGYGTQYTILTLPVPSLTNVYIPDAQFKAALVANKSINTNGDSEIQFTEAAAYKGSLVINNKAISSLIGIEAFTALNYLYCMSNNLTSLDVSKNTALSSLFCSDNKLTSIDVSKNIALTGFGCSSNQLTTLDLSKNKALTTIDVKNNTYLTFLNIANGNNTKITGFKATNCLFLKCIQVDNVSDATAKWTVANGNIDKTATFSLSCK